MSDFTSDEAFLLSRINVADRRFMSRLDLERLAAQVQALMQGNLGN
jgi:hypothetical protein